MFGKNNEETVGLLKVSANKLDGDTKYGTVEKKLKKKPTVGGLFRYASKGDVVLMSIGVICSAIHGSSFPVLALVFGQMTNVFIKQASVTSTENKSLVNVPLTVVGNTLDLIHTDPFNSTYNYTNIIHKNNVSKNSPLNDESSTFGAFFMSEMERMSTVRSITDMDLRKTTDIPNQSIDNALSPEEFYNYMTKFSLYYLYIGCAVLIAAFIQTFSWEIACERQIHRLRKVFYCQILRQEISWYDLNDGGDLTAKFSDDLERVREGIGSKFSMVTQYLSTLFTGIVIGLCVNWRLTLIILCVTPFLVAVSGALALISASTAAREQIKYGLAGGIAKEVLLNIQIVAAFGGELKESKRYELAIEEGRKLAMKKYYVFSILLGSVFVIMYSVYGIAFWYGSNLIVDRISSPGSIFTVFFSVMAGAFSVGNALPFINSVSVAIGAASNVFDIIDNKPNIDPYSSKGKKIHKIQGKIEFKNVNFAYPTRCSTPVLNNLSLKIEPGQTVALVGSSGGGKSTVGSLLLRFYDPTEGQVLLDNFDLKYLNLHWLRQNIGVVSQEPVLFGVSIAENIRYGQSDCTRQDIIAAAMTANAHSFIIKLPKGYDTLVGDKGSQLSGCQKQRIVIARALVKDPKILLLDEATSALDAQSEGIVQEALDKAQQGRSTIIIAHRLSTIRNVDVIFVLQNGSVVESGTHNFLMAKNGLYSNLFNTQVKQENNESNEDNSLESDEEIMDVSILDDKIINTEYAISSTSQPKNKKISLKPEIENVYMKDIFKFNRPEWPWLMMGFIGCTLTGAIMPVFAVFYGQVFATFTLKGDELLQEAAFWSKMFIVLALLSGLAWWMQTFGFTHACEKLIMRMRIYAFENVLRQPVFWFDFKNSSTSNIINRLAREAPLVKSAGSLRIAQVISAFVTLSAALIIAFSFGWKLAVVLVIGVPIIAGATYKQLVVLQKSQKQDLECMDKADRITYETISSIKTVQGLALELMFVSQYENSLKDPLKAAKKQAFSFAIMYAVSQAVIYGMYSVSFRYGAYLVETGDMSATDIYRVFFALAFCAASVGQTSAYLQDYSRAKIAASLIFQLIRRKSEIDPLSNSGSKPTIKGKVHFKDVKFEYPSRPNICVLRGLNLIVEPGKILAIVGESGCGKSTILSLLERFYNPSKGVIEVDNHDIRAMNLCHLRQNIGIVTQEPILFNCSIKDNIAYGVVNREVSMDEIIDAAKKANIHNFITTLAQRYDTLVGDQGSQLSEGQKQRVAIARALIRNPKILLLDEATTALDTESEVIIQETLKAACKGRTCIIIAHRLSTIQLADFIAVVHKGKIVEQGNHDELKAKKKYYYELISHREESCNQLQF